MSGEPVSNIFFKVFLKTKWNHPNMPITFTNWCPTLPAVSSVTIPWRGILESQRNTVKYHHCRDAGADIPRTQKQPVPYSIFLDDSQAPAQCTAMACSTQPGPGNSSKEVDSPTPDHPKSSPRAWPDEPAHQWYIVLELALSREVGDSAMGIWTKFTWSLT
jgi:hypothetical protein